MESEAPDQCREPADFSDLRGSPFGFWTKHKIREKRTPRKVESFLNFLLFLIGFSVFLFLIEELFEVDKLLGVHFPSFLKKDIFWYYLFNSPFQAIISWVSVILIFFLFFGPVILKLYPNIDSHFRFFQEYSSFKYLEYFTGILILLIVLENIYVWQNSSLLYAVISIVIIIIIGILMMSLIQIKNSIAIQEIEDHSEKQASSIKGTGRLLSYELNELNKLYNFVNFKRIPAKPLYSNYPESLPPGFKTKDVTYDYGNVREEILEVKGIQVPFKYIVAFVRKLTGGCNINVTINSLGNKYFLTAEMIGSFNYSKHIKPNRKIKKLFKQITNDKIPFPKQNDIESKTPVKNIWQVEFCANSSESRCYENIFHNKIKELAGSIYTDVFLSGFDFRAEAINYFNAGLRAYQDAIHQPFLRRQLLTDAECCFRNAIQEDDCFYQAIHNLGIVYLDLGMEAQAIRVFNSVIDKKHYRDSCYALASSLFDPIRNVYASYTKKFLGPESDKGPYVNLLFPDIYRKFDEVNEINNRIFDKVIFLCSGVIESAVPDYLTILALDLRSTVYMYLGKTDLFYNDCRNAVELGFELYQSLHYEDTSTEIYRKGLINSLQNYAMVCMREAQRKSFCRIRHLEREKKEYCYSKQLKKYRKYYKNAIKATKLAEELNSKDADTYYIRGRAHFEFRKNYDKAKDALKRATNLQPDNFNYKANYVASIIMDCNPDDYDLLKWSINTLFNCPSQIRHESMERISRIDKSVMNKKYNIIKNKEFSDLIDYSIKFATIFTCIAHHIDRSPIAKSMFLKDDQLIYKNLSALFDLLEKDCKIDNSKAIDINTICGKSVSKCIIDFGLNIIKNDLDMVCGTQKTDCPIEFAINSILENILLLLGNYNPEPGVLFTWNQLNNWIRGQLYTMTGRNFMLKSNYCLASCCFIKAIDLLKDEYPEEIQRQKLYSSYGYSLSRLKIHDESSKFTSEALSQDPLDPMAYFASGMINYNMENYYTAQELFHKALSLSPEPKWNPVQLWYDNPILIQHADLYMYFGISSIKLAESKRLKEYRIKALEEGIQAFSSLINILNITPQIDTKYPYHNSIEIVLSNCKDSIQKKAYYWLGKAYFLKGLYREAIEHLCLSDQKSLCSIFYIARSYHLSHELCKAIECFNKIIEDKDKELRDGAWADDSTCSREEITQLSQLYRACCYAATNQINGAEKDKSDVEKEIDHNIKYNNCRLKSALQATEGIIHYHNGCFSESIRLLSQALSNSTDPVILDYLQLSFIHPFLNNSNESQARTCLLQAEAISKMGESVNVSVVDNKILKARADRLSEIVQPGNELNLEQLKLLISHDNGKEKG